MNLVKILPLTALLAISACDSEAKKEVVVGYARAKN